jgi:hypothetical protein
MQAAGWGKCKGTFSVLAAVPGVHQLFGLAAAVWDAFSKDDRPHVPSQDFAYAPYVSAEL